jgi:Alcohol dehydrogenase GroES-like domain
MNDERKWPPPPHYRCSSSCGSQNWRKARLEFAGEVAEIGSKVMGVTEGDHVMAMGQGAFADYARIDHRLLIPVPTTFSRGCASRPHDHARCRRDQRKARSW